MIDYILVIVLFVVFTILMYLRRGHLPAFEFIVVVSVLAHVLFTLVVANSRKVKHGDYLVSENFVVVEEEEQVREEDLDEGDRRLLREMDSYGYWRHSNTLAWFRFGSIPGYLRDKFFPKFDELINVVAPDEETEAEEEGIHLNEEYFVKRKDKFPELFTGKDGGIDPMLITNLIPEISQGSMVMNYVERLNPETYKQIVTEAQKLSVDQSRSKNAN